MASTPAEEALTCTVAQLNLAYLRHAGLKPADLENPNPASALQFLVNPSAQIQELQQALTALSGQTANSQVGLSLPHICSCIHMVMLSCLMRMVSSAGHWA